MGALDLMLDYGYGDDEEREFAEREDIAQEQALRILLGLDEPLTESTSPAPWEGPRASKTNPTTLPERSHTE